MKLKKFNQFIKESIGMDDDIESLEGGFGADDNGDFDKIEDFNDVLGDSRGEEEDRFDGDNEGDDYSKFEEEDDENEYRNSALNQDDNYTEEEEEGHEYKGNLLMKELADKLGTQVVNNKIDYNGQEINYFSETEKFHIGKSKFDSIEEVLDFLGEEDSEFSSDIPTEEESLVGESRRFIKRF